MNLIRRHPALIFLIAFATLALLSACETSPVSSPDSLDHGMGAPGAATGTLGAESHGGGNSNSGGNGHHNDGNDNDNDNGDDDHGGNNGSEDHGHASCPKPGARLEIEGIITSTGTTSVLVHQQGGTDFLCQVNRATRIRKGSTTYTLKQLQIGWQVHVKGTGQTPTVSNAPRCRAAAEEINVQRTH